MSWKCLPLRIQMFTGFLPLWCGIAPRQHAEKLVNTNYLADDRLCARWGARSLSVRESMYSLEFSSNPSNWLGPVWIIVNYFVWKALQRYGYKKEADALADTTLLLLSRNLARNGSLNEYYHRHRSSLESQGVLRLESSCPRNDLARDNLKGPTKFPDHRERISIWSGGQGIRHKLTIALSSFH